VAVRAFAPGRVNLLGEHTDYNDGLALPFAVKEGVTVAASPRPGGDVEALAFGGAQRDIFSVRDPEPAHGWRAYVRGAVAELAREGVELGGARIRIDSTLPSGGGLSSSSAVLVSVSLALIALSGTEAPDPFWLARLAARVEHRWAGAQTGLLDPLASLLGRPETAVRIDFHDLGIEEVPLRLGDHRLVVLDSGEHHSLAAGSGYERRRAECEEARRRLGLSSLRDAALADCARLPAPLDRRLRHLVSENERVEGAVDALRCGDLDGLGRLLNASHASLRDDYEVSTAAVERTIERCQRAGAIGARIVGGGFGGHVLALLPPGASAPEGSVEVRACAGARLLDER
jgi:galactokinase